MKIEAMPVKIMAEMMAFRAEMGKFLAMLTADQSSTTRDATSRMGMVRRLL
jgi:hypothetical protein